jgi:hypothetical protein
MFMSNMYVYKAKESKEMETLPPFPCARIVEACCLFPAYNLHKYVNYDTNPCEFEIKIFNYSTLSIGKIVHFLGEWEILQVISVLCGGRKDERVFCDGHFCMVILYGPFRLNIQLLS